MAKRIQTRERIIDVANRLFYEEGIRAVSVDTISEKAGISKKTLYYHFKSKDDLIAAYLTARDQPNLALFETWFEEAEGDRSAAEGFCKESGLSGSETFRQGYQIPQHRHNICS